MNTSRRTAIIAQGIALYAVVQDMSPDDIARDYAPVQAWDTWAEEHVMYVEFVKREQFKLFDRVNAAF